MDTSSSVLLSRLGVAPDDAQEVLGDAPPADLLERSRNTLVGALADLDGEAGPFPPPPAAPPLFAVHVILAAIEDIRRRHEQLGIPDDIAWATLSHLGRAMTAYRRTNGNAGVQLTGWDWLRYTCWLYDVGRLEVTPYRIRTYPKEAGPLFWYDEATAARLGPGFRKGDAALGIHVPAGDPLTAAACDKSLDRLRTAFVKVCASGPPRVATCTSWLLDDQLGEYLPADSNILAFQRRFECVAGARDNDEAILAAVFGAARPKELDALPRNTALERAVVEHLRAGRHWRMRTGLLRL